MVETDEIDIEGTLHAWDRDTITTPEIIELRGWSADQGVVEVDLKTQDEQTLAADEVVTLKPGHGFSKRSSSSGGLADGVGRGQPRPATDRLPGSRPCCVRGCPLGPDSGISSVDRAFVVREWRAIPATGFEIQSPFHVTLKDETKRDIIRWAWDRGLCLIEAHSHEELYPAELSSSDLWGLSEWVPQLSWRLQGRPYAALVVAGEGVDGLAWVDGVGAPEPVMSLDLDDGEVIRTTACTLERLKARSRWDAQAAIGD